MGMEPTAGYEFGANENQLIADLGRKMRIVGLILMIIGVIMLIGGLLTITKGGYVMLFQGAVQLVIGLWTRKAATSFEAIVATQGSDVPNLMLALAELRKLYALQYWVLIISGIVIFLSMIAGVVIAMLR